MARDQGAWESFVSDLDCWLVGWLVDWLPFDVYERESGEMSVGLYDLYVCTS